MCKTEKSSGNVKSGKESQSIRLMKFLEKMEIERLNPYNINLYAVAAAIFFILSIIVYCFQARFSDDDNGNGYHKETLPSSQLCYINNGDLVPLSDGAYPLAMPSQDSTLEINGEKVFPMLLILVPNADGDFELYPLNIADDSVLPRQGRILALHILFGFTSDHAENTLVYEEKVNDTAAEDYKRKAFYYLRVKDGYGKMERGYMNKENAGEGFKYYRDVNHVKEELITIYHMENKFDD